MFSLLRFQYTKQNAYKPKFYLKKLTFTLFKKEVLLWQTQASQMAF